MGANALICFLHFMLLTILKQKQMVYQCKLFLVSMSLMSKRKHFSPGDRAKTMHEKECIMHH